MKKLILVVIILPFIHFLSFSQSIDTVESVNPPKHIISISPLHLLNRFPTAFLHYETNLTGSFNVALGIGAVLDLEDESVTTERDFLYSRGYKINNEYKYYYLESKNVLLSVLLLFEYFDIRFDRGRTFGFDCNDRFTCSYYQFNEYEVRRQHYRVGLKSTVMAKVDKHFVIEFGLGVVLDVRNYSHTDRLTDFDVQFGDTRLKEEGREINYLPIPHLKLGYLIR